MTPTEARTRAECEAQGLPFTVQDPAALARVARIVAGAARTKNADAGAPASVSRDACGGTVTATPKDAA